MLKKKPPSHLAADAVLLGVSVFWGTSFAIIKEALGETPPENLLFIRFFLACLVLLPVGWRRRKTWSGELLKPGILIGFFLFIAFFTQAWGLVFTTASRSGFITGLNVILVPLLSILVFRHLPPRLALVGAGLAFFGLYLLTSADPAQALPFNWGDFLTLICAVFWAAHILALGRYSPGVDTFWLTFVQLVTCCLGSLGWVSLTGKLDLTVPLGVWGAATYLAVSCTVLAYLGQTWAQARTTPTRTAIILSMEPVFAALFAWFWLGERMGLWGWMGAGLILGGIFLAELRTVSSKW
ncbi:MAG: DMT family transporter [Deltaproteobacteria bacterium]|nr:DMT family transporter [Deltaproteobacteria bacterium]